MSSRCETHISRSLAESVAWQRPELVIVSWFAFGLLPGVRTGALPALRPYPSAELHSPTMGKLYLCFSSSQKLFTCLSHLYFIAVE